ncbi:glycosyltransferase family 2 protein [Candidatus Saccharibacteria bacterium]|nr:MAG: glycosyltransferase family 2 protein [Candidatus Saccharibacteria bacterium]
MGQVDNKRGKKTLKLTIAIPAYNCEKTIRESVESALSQAYPDKEVLVINDGSTDKTREVLNSIEDIRVIDNPENMGIGYTLTALIREAKGKYILFLCADDLFTSPLVATDVVHQFNMGDPMIGVIGRYYYFFMNGQEGAIGVCRDRNILTSSCCPSGMAFRKMKDDQLDYTNDIFIEMPYIVAQYLQDWKWTMLEYDTIAARFHPGGNTGTKTSYYTQSPTKNWYDLVGRDFRDFPMFIQLKNRAPKLLWEEICLVVKNDRNVLLSLAFWFYSLTALLLPGAVLRHLSCFYRHRIARIFASVIERPN